MTFSLLYKGFDYPAFYNGAYEDSGSLPSLVQTGANSIEATLDYGIDVTTSQVVADSNYTDSLAALGNTIHQAESLGLSVMVRPLIDFLNPAVIAPYSVGDWRQFYQPTNVATFFASYKQMIVAEAQVAEQNGAQMLSIGGELDQLTGSQYLSYWTDIISSVRAVFGGKLTYSASWNTASNVSFWSQLDYAGIDCYVPLSNAQSPTLQDLVDGWIEPATQSKNPGAYAWIGNQSPIQYFEGLAAQFGKPLLFTELGYANDSGAAANPSASGNSPDPALQSELYQAFFQAWGQSGSSSLIGTYFWEWDPNGSTLNVGPTVDSFSPQNNPAQNEATAGFKTVIGNGETQVVSSGHTLYATTVQSGGTEIVGSGGTANGSMILTGSFQVISPGGTAIDTIMNGSATISGGRLELTGAASASGPITFAGTGGTLQIDGVAMPSAVISGFVPGDTIDLAGVGFANARSISLKSGNVLEIVENSNTYDLHFDPSQNFSGWHFALSFDGSGGTDIRLQSQKSDFNRDRSSDILWRNGTTGAVETWLMTNGQVSGGTGVGTVSSAWQVVGTGDLNGDGTSDVLWRNTAGPVESWLITNGRIGGGTGVGFVSSAWQALGTGDFNGDGTSDALWRNVNTGEVDDWLITNGHLSGGAAVGIVSTAWQFVGIGDFNGDGTSDVLWRNTASGEIDTWLMSNGHNIGGTAISQVSSAWQPLGTGDFNGDGMSDVLWQDTSTGAIHAWLMGNGHVSSDIIIGTVPSASQFAGIGDYNGDGTGDVLWRKTTTGEVDTWLISNGHIVGGSAIGTVSGAWTSSPSGAAVAGTTAAGQAGAELASLAGGTATGGFPGSDGLWINAPGTPITDRIWPSDSSVPGDAPSWLLTREGSSASDPQVSTARPAASDLLWNASVPIANRPWGSDGLATDLAISPLVTGRSSTSHMPSG